MKLSLQLLLILSVFSITVVCQIELVPAQIKSTLNKKYPGWRFSEVSKDVQEFFRDRFPGAYPNFIKGDFDGDGRTDFAMLIEHSNFAQSGKAFSHLVETTAFLKRGTKYKLFVLEDQFPANPIYYLNLRRKGEKGREFKSRKTFRYPNDSISTSFFEKAGGTYIYRKGRFRFVTESD